MAADQQTEQNGSDITRRDLIRGTVVTALGLTAMGALLSETTSRPDVPELSAKEVLANFETLRGQTVRTAGYPGEVTTSTRGGVRGLGYQIHTFDMYDKPQTDPGSALIGTGQLQTAGRPTGEHAMRDVATLADAKAGRKISSKVVVGS